MANLVEIICIVHLEQNSSAVKINHEKKHHYGPIDLVHWKMNGSSIVYIEFCFASGHNNDAHGTNSLFVSTPFQFYFHMHIGVGKFITDYKLLTLPLPIPTNTSFSCIGNAACGWNGGLPCQCVKTLWFMKHKATNFLTMFFFCYHIYFSSEVPVFLTWN